MEKRKMRFSFFCILQILGQLKNGIISPGLHAGASIRDVEISGTSGGSGTGFQLT